MRVDCAEQMKDRPTDGAALRRNFHAGDGWGIVRADYEEDLLFCKCKS